MYGIFKTDDLLSLKNVFISKTSQSKGLINIYEV